MPFILFHQKIKKPHLHVKDRVSTQILTPIWGDNLKQLYVTYIMLNKEYSYFARSQEIKIILIS